MHMMAGMEIEGKAAEAQQGKRRREEPENGSQKDGDQKWVGQGAMDKLEGILGRMNLAQEEVDWEAEVHEVMAEEGAERLGKKLWYGDDMGPGTRGAETGCRIVVQNMQGKCGHHDGTMYRMEEELIWNLKVGADIIVLHEPGDVGRIAHILKGVAKKHDCTALIHMEGAGKPEGVIIILTQQWRMVWESSTPIKGIGHSPARAVQVEFKAAGPREKRPGNASRDTGDIGQVREQGPPLARMALFAVYGYADKTGASKAESAAMWNTVKGRVEKFRERHRTGTVVVAGDLNAAKWSAIDTDRLEAGMWDREADAGLITWIEGNLKVKDTFREAHPQERAHTRNPQGKKALTDAKRRIDQIWVSNPAASSPHMRAGIPKEPRHGLGSDHRPMITDIGIDCADMADGTAPLWDPHTVTTLRPKKGVTEEDKMEMNQRFQGSMGEADQGVMNLEDRGAAMIAALQGAMDGTIANKVQQQYPRWAATTEYREGWGHSLDTWCKRMNGACCALKKMRTVPDRDKLKEALDKARWPHPDIPTGIEMDKMQNLWEQWENVQKRDELRCRLVRQMEVIKAHERKEREARVRQKVQAAVKARNDNFGQADGKGKGKVLKSIFRAAREYDELTWARREDGTLASAQEEVEHTVRTFFEKWFQSRVSVEERWGTRGHFDRLDTSQMDARYQEFMKECYLDPMATNKMVGDRDGWWEGIRDAITMGELEEAISRSNSGTAAGPSQVGIDAIKALSGESKQHVMAFMNACLTENKIPDCLNSALMRLLPKSDKGLADLNAVRPIALMENVIKVYEQILVGRVLRVLMEHEVLDLGQFRALPKGGVAAPLRIMANIMEAARR